jgi:D-serine deaminase-like pyridoxal phosphate-dependent protein
LEIGAKGRNVLREDLPLPIAVLRSSALDQNSNVMRDFLNWSSASLCPHGKTTMSSQLFQRRVEDGAWGLTVATPHQVALEVWGYVQYVPERSLAIITAGKCDGGHDLGLAIPIKWFRPNVHSQPVPLDFEHIVLALSDHHAHALEPWLAGRRPDRVGRFSSCTTFDKWKVLFLVDESYNVTSAVETLF